MQLEEAAVPNRSIFQSLAYNTPNSKYVGSVDLLTPIKELQALKDKAELSSGFVRPVNALDPDVTRRDEIHNSYKQKIQEISEYENPHEQLRAIKRLGQMYADDATIGELGHIAKSYNNYSEVVKEATEKLDKGEIDEIGYWKMVKQPYSNFTGTRANDKGGYSTFNGNKVGKYSDIAKEASDFAQQWSSDKGFRATVDGGYINERTHEYVSKKEVAQQTYNYLANNPKYREQLGNFVEYHGKEGTEELHKLIAGIATPIANREAFDKYDGNMSADPYGLMNYKKKLEDEANNIVNTKSTSKLNVEAPELITPGLQFDKTGKVIEPEKPSMGESRFFIQTPEGAIFSESAYNKALSVWKASTDKESTSNKINTLATKLGLDSKLSNKAKYEAITRHQETNKERALSSFIGTPDVQGFLTEQTFRNGNFDTSEFKVGNKTFKNINDFGTYLIESGTLPESVGSNIGDVKEYIRKNATVSGTIAGMGRYDSKNNAAHSASLNGTEFFISGDEQIGQALSPVNELQKQVINPNEAGKPIGFRGSDGEVDYFAVKFTNGDYTVKAVDEKGKEIPELKDYNFDLQVLGQTALTNYQKSNYSSAIFSGSTKQEKTLGE